VLLLLRRRLLRNLLLLLLLRRLLHKLPRHSPLRMLRRAHRIDVVLLLLHVLRHSLRHPHRSPVLRRTSERIPMMMHGLSGHGMMHLWTSLRRERRLMR
jgi:hypothetical protein